MSKCYKHALTLCLANPDTTLVHGIPRGQGDIQGIRFGHAWLEYITEKFGETVYDPTTMQEYPKEAYYNIGDIKYTKAYTSEEARKLSLEHSTYGPWDEEIGLAVHYGD